MLRIDNLNRSRKINTVPKKKGAPNTQIDFEKHIKIKMGKPFPQILSPEEGAQKPAANLS